MEPGWSMLRDSFKDLEDSDCILSEEHKVDMLMETFQHKPHRHLSCTVACNDKLMTDFEATAHFIQEELRRLSFWKG